MTPSNIGWTDYVWNAGGGCARVSPGCEFCWAETLSPRLAKMGQERHVGLTVAGENGARWSRESADWPDRLAEPMKVKAPKRVFVFSMSDLFYERRSFEYIAAVFGVMAACQHHTFQVLTKRPERALAFLKEWLPQEQSDSRQTPAEVCRSWALEMIPGARGANGAWVKEVHALLGYDTRWPLPNVHLGVTVEDQQRADERIPLLLQCPVAVRWVSAEPLLERIDLNAIDATKAGWRAAGPWAEEPTAISAFGKWQETPMRARLQNGIDWLVVGGETGEGRREVDVAAIEDVARQCVTAGVPVFVKQDAGKYPGRQGRISDATWARKEFPADAQRAAEGGR